jgi:hypothetical protein
MTDLELIQMALNRFEKIYEGCGYVKEDKSLNNDAKQLSVLISKDCFDLIKVLRERVSQPEPPIECQTETEKKAFACGWSAAMEKKREWIGLPETDVKIFSSDFFNGARWAEAQLREKNS